MDARVRKIAEETFGHSNLGQIPVVERRIRSAIERSAAGQFNTMPSLRYRNEELYPYEIRCPKTAGANAPRVYFSEITPSNADDELAKYMMKIGVHKIVVMVGASLKSSQLELLLELTDESRAALRNKRIGSI